MTRRLTLSILVFLLLFAGRQRAVQHPVVTPLDIPPVDVFSWSEPSKVVVRHVSLDLTVDFEARRLAGSASLWLHNVIGTRTLVLDTRDLTIHRVVLDDGRDATFTLGIASALGRPLTIAIEPATRSLRIDYTTSSQASGLEWVTAQQTYGRQQPFLYSQNEAHHARSWIPIQDTPQIRVTYDATVRVPPGMLALMSAANPQAVVPDGVYRFAMDQTVPPYLIAVAAGRLEFRALSERTGIYVEPELAAAAVHDVHYLPDMLAAAERLLGPHPWGRHDILLMPPTYIVGGMEHPRLNFINPFSVVTFNAANPLPSTLIAHELAHSWAGDMTTLATWEDVWLNEGITSYLAQRILEEMVGTERVEYAYFLDRSNFENHARNPPSPSVTILHRGYVKDESPDERFDTTQYTKGELFLRTLEDELGRPVFDDFLRSYFAEYAFRWVDDRNFLASLERKGLAHDRLRLQEWIYQPGLPSNVSAPTTSRIYTRVQAEATAFANGRAARLLSTSGWTDVEMELFLNLAASAVRSRMAEVDTTFSLTARETPPLWWLLNGIYSRYSPIYAAVERVLLRGGTNSRMVTLYSALMNDSEGRQVAARVFATARDRYHPATAKQIEELLRKYGLAEYERAA
ncbi:MAG: M1 family aminopeptidase/hydrolase [Thermoanaerobaculia bacterium]